MAKGLVINKFKQIHRTVTNVVGFANVLDLYDYLGDANITVQTAFRLPVCAELHGLLHRVPAV